MGTVSFASTDLSLSLPEGHERNNTRSSNEKSVHLYGSNNQILK